MFPALCSHRFNWKPQREAKGGDGDGGGSGVISSAPSAGPKTADLLGSERQTAVK